MFKVMFPSLFQPIGGLPQQEQEYTSGNEEFQMTILTPLSHMVM